MPAHFETRKRKLRQDARQKTAEANASRAQRELELYEQRERYRVFLAEQAGAHIRSKIPAAAIERLRVPYGLGLTDVRTAVTVWPVY